MTTISAQSVLASRHPVSGDVLHTLLLRYPRWIHAEVMTHRMFSRNAASSRAIPAMKLIEDIIADPALPIVWTKNQKGMQGYEELSHMEQRTARFCWARAMNASIAEARYLMGIGAHKQVINRLLEPYAHITVVVSATNWSNFLALRDHPAAEPHIQMLAREVRKALETANIQTLQTGEWHLPFVSEEELQGMTETDARKLSVARCASTSYKTVDGFDMTLERARQIYDDLTASTPPHASPFEHVAQADWMVMKRLLGRPEWQKPQLHGNFTGFIQLRKTLPGECL